MEQTTVLIVDDTESSLFMLKMQLEEWGFSVLAAGSGKAALELLKTETADLVLSDQMMPEMDGLELLHAVKKLNADIPFIMLTAHGTIHKAVSSIRKGADDYLEKPYDPEVLRAAIERALHYSRLSREHRELSDYFSTLRGFQTIVTRSPRMCAVLDMAKKVAQTPYTSVAISGESGTGKEVLARAIHTTSGLMENRFVAVNCAAIPANLLESELFGHAKGAFTGADRDREGKFDLARQGTILLDEIGDMPLELQAKLLRVLEERTYQRVGANTPIKADFRVITTTHRDLKKMVGTGRFREDLYHRISMFPLTLPPLRERPEDIPLLVENFLEQLRGQLGKPLPGISKAAMKLMNNYSWTGNIRELKNCVERAAILTDGELIRPNHLNIATTAPPSDDVGSIRLDISMPAGEFSLAAAVNRIMEITLKKCNDNKSRAAELLKVDRKLFYRRKEFTTD
jgi:DNA-binding NtrC family response regulator